MTSDKSCAKGRVAAVPVEWRRLLAAAAIVVCIVLAVPAADAFLHRSGVVDAGAPIVLDAEAIIAGKDVDEVVSRLEQAANQVAEASGLPGWFQEEVGLLPDARDVRLSNDATVIGYVVDADCQEVLDDLCAHMASRGWTNVPLGQLDGATFVKDSGRCTWVLATCTQVQSSTSVVMRCVHDQEQ